MDTKEGDHRLCGRCGERQATHIWREHSDKPEEYVCAPCFHILEDLLMDSLYKKDKGAND